VLQKEKSEYTQDETDNVTGKEHKTYNFPECSKIDKSLTQIRTCIKKTLEGTPKSLVI